MSSSPHALSSRRYLGALTLCLWCALLFSLIGVGLWRSPSAQARSPLADRPNLQPLAVSSAVSVTDLWGGGSESIGLRSDGTVWTWGWDQYGMLGNGHGVTGFYTGTEYDSLVPFQVLGENGVGHLGSIIAIAGGERHNVALDPNGEIWTWGLHSFGQLGIGPLADCTSQSMTDLDCMRTTPVKIPNFTSVKAIASRGYHTLALKNDDTVWAWGWNGYGQIGTGFVNYPVYPIEFSPVPVIGLTGTVHGKVIAISGGGDVSAALMQDHTLMAWGNNTQGAVGNGQMSPAEQYTPTQVLTSTGLLSVTMIATGWNHMVALDANGDVWTWGANDNGQLGNGTKGYASSSSVPIRVGGVLSNVVGVSAGDGSTAVLTADGHVWAWGVLRTETITSTSAIYDYGPTPVQVAGIDHVILVRDRDWHVLALKSDGTVWAWGWNLKGQIGDGTRGGDKTTPVQVLFDLPSAPVITSAPIATGTIGLPFSYTVTATGTLPITFTVMGLPTWANFNSPVISGTPDLNGAYPVTLTATNDFGRDVKRLTIFIGQVFNVYLPLVWR